jgi:hypothetical protein
MSDNMVARLRQQVVDDWVRDTRPRSSGGEQMSFRSPEVEPCALCAEGWRIKGDARCHECQEGRIDLLVQALALQEVAETAHLKCDECDPSDAPETCGKCFPLYDDARIARRRALAYIKRRS